LLSPLLLLLLLLLLWAINRQEVALVAASPIPFTKPQTQGKPQPLSQTLPKPKPQAQGKSIPLP
jgi:hypothetical protein